MVYLDDVIVTGPTEEAHLRSQKDVLQCLVDHGLRLKRSKCTFVKKIIKSTFGILTRLSQLWGDWMFCSCYISHTLVWTEWRLTKTYDWWPKLDAEPEEVVGTCLKRQENRELPTASLLHPWEGCMWTMCRSISGMIIYHRRCPLRVDRDLPSHNLYVSCCHWLSEEKLQSRQKWCSRIMDLASPVENSRPSWWRMVWTRSPPPPGMQHPKTCRVHCPNTHRCCWRKVWWGLWRLARTLFSYRITRVNHWEIHQQTDADGS